MTHYHWLSFSKLALPGESGNLGVYILTSERPLTVEEIKAEVERRGITPPDCFNVVGVDMDEDNAIKYKLDTFMTREELMKRDDVVSSRSQVEICDDCTEQMKRPN